MRYHQGKELGEATRVAYRLPATVTEDRQLVVELPADIKPGKFEVVIKPLPIKLAANDLPLTAQELARQELAEAGLLSTAFDVLPEGLEIADEDEMIEDVPPGTLQRYLDEEREDRA